MGARVGRCIALSSSQTQDHNITRGSVNQGVCRVARHQQAASLESVLSFCLPDRTVVGFGQGLSPLNNCRANIAPTILIVSCADGSYYFEVWDQSKFERQQAAV